MQYDWIKNVKHQNIRQDEIGQWSFRNFTGFAEGFRSIPAVCGSKAPWHGRDEPLAFYGIKINEQDWELLIAITQILNHSCKPKYFFYAKCLQPFCSRAIFQFFISKNFLRLNL